MLSLNFEGAFKDKRIEKRGSIYQSRCWIKKQLYSIGQVKEEVTMLVLAGFLIMGK